jgi:hypothetical protein
LWNLFYSSWKRRLRIACLPVASRLYLHIGLTKTGTSYLQSVLRDNREVLKQQGLLLPGRWRDRIYVGLELRDLVERRRRDPDRVHGTWGRLLEEMRTWPGDAIISNELFETTRSEQVGRIVKDVSPRELHVVVTVRDLVRAVPSTWQQSLKQGKEWTLPAYAESIITERGDTRRFQRNQFPELVLSRWQAHVPSERIHVVVVPPPGSPPALLWQRFCQPLGIDPEVCDLNVNNPNESLGAVECELLRRVNVNLVPRLEPRHITRWIRNELSDNLLARRSGRQSLSLPESACSWAVGRGRETVERLRYAGYDVSGSLDDLLPANTGSSPRSPERVRDDELLAAAVETISELVVRLRDTTIASRATRRELLAAQRRLRVVRRRQKAARRRLRRLQDVGSQAQVHPPTPRRRLLRFRRRW